LLDAQQSPDFHATLLGKFYNYFLPDELEPTFEDDPMLLTQVAFTWFGEVCKELQEHKRAIGYKEEKQAKANEGKYIKRTLVDVMMDKASEDLGANRFNVLNWVRWVADKSEYNQGQLFNMTYPEFIEVSNIAQYHQDIIDAQEMQAEADQKEKEQIDKARGIKR
jgi:hypothetical protein